MEVWAKSNGTRLSKHIEHILQVFEKIKNKVSCDFHLPIKLSIFYHDLGKVLPKFQIETLGNKDYEPFDIIHSIPHSLFSVFWINIEKLKEKLCDERLAEIIISSVAYHHWRDNFDDYITGKEDLKNFCEFVFKVKNELKNNLQNEINSLSDDELKNYIGPVDLNEKFSNEIKNGVKLYNIAIPPYKFDYEPLREGIAQSIDDTKKWILISGFLQRCDHFASWCEEENESFDKVEIECMKSEDVKNKIKNEISQKTGISDEQQIWQFSKVKDYINKDLILIAPTGYGKTEFAFLWSADKKLIYTLPLRSAVNQIYDRSLKIFGNDKVGLLHSDADVYLIEKLGDVGDNIKLYELSKNLSFPVIISTGDQFFPYALKPPGYEKIFSLFSYSNLVIDEVQAYDPKACAIIVKFIEWVKIMEGNFLLMTATMPEFVKKILKEEKNIQYEEINIYEEGKQEFEKIVKHKIKIEFIENERRKFEIPDDVLDKVIKKAQSGKRVLFILNTVKQAQEVYEKIKHKNTSIEVFLLHSRFTLEDRKNKEIEIISKKFKNPKPDDEKEGKILVATQVVEASLDIDADILFTEICPLDALVQRMGRVLRRIGPNFKFENGDDKKRLYKDNQNETYKVDLSEPNVYVLIFKDWLESGDGRVYPKELLKLSIAWLWKKSKEDIKNKDFKEDEENKKKEFFEREFKEIFSESPQKPSKGKKKKDGDNEILKKIIEEDDWVKNLNIQEFEISEYEKYKLVSLFYESLPEDGSYLKKFYETLDILSAGYMSDKKTEAERIFREIYDIQIIPENKLNDFIGEIIGFDYDGKNFTAFKREILSKYVVSVPYFEVGEKDWVFYKIQENIDDQGKLKKLKRWLSGIFVSKRYEYNEELGAKRSDSKESDAMIF